MQKNKALRTAVIVAMACVLGAPSSFAAGAPQPQMQQQPKKKEQKPGKATPQSKAGQPGSKPGSQPSKPSAAAQKRPDWKKKGGKMPKQSFGPQVDYKKHNLKKPPEGYRWVRHGDDFVLIAITTGIISAIIKATH